jgi:hypothetical protein
MKNKIQQFSLILLFLSLAGCASIVSKSSWPFSVDTSPSGAKVVITNKSGQEIFSGRTPAAMKLASGAGFFSKEAYVVTLSMDNFETKKINIDCKLNGWYIGNIAVGGIIGFLIVDPATGAMYKLENDGIFETLTPTDETTTTNTLKVLDIRQIPNEWKQHLVKVH